jgi:hypothetical protein
MIALNLDHPFLERPAGAATALERRGQLLEGVFGHGHAGHRGHGLAATAFAFAAHAGNAVSGWNQSAFADAGVDRLTAFGTVTSGVGRKHQATQGGEGSGFFRHGQSSS